MPISSQLTNEGHDVTIRTGERFDYSAHSEFRSAYKDTPSNANYTVDMSNTSYMDSSALGMLLLLREYAGGDSSSIQISGCNAEIKKILEISNFHKLFDIA